MPDQPARHQHPIGAGELAREPTWAGDAIEQQPSGDADDEQKQENDSRAEHGRDLLDDVGARPQPRC
jgi:hypothetical protein